MRSPAYPRFGRRVARERVALQQLGDAEVEQFGLAVRCDQQVARLQVAVDDQVLMGELDRGAGGEKQLDPGA
jgi:hypothetical protein